ncbi:MAG TPA: cytochrome c oxidase assembly protein [Burkholderiales bacterium]
MHGLTVAVLAAALGLYLLGVARLWRRAGAGRAIRLPHFAAFGAGWLVAAAALLSPLHHYAERLLWAHMVQHELLMVLAAPLLVLGKPVEAWSWVLPLRIPRLLGDATFAWTLHAAAVWLWHAPRLFEAAVGSDWLHLAQHASFFVSAALFWWTVLAPAARPLPAVVSLLATMIHTGVLGALMTFSRTSWYAGYALEDQQLAGLVMWVPAGIAYPLGALLIVSRSLLYSSR